MRIDEVVPTYVKHIPRAPLMEQGKLYISLEFECAIHLCACGCSTQVVTPLRMNTGWELKQEENGTVVSLTPSIGNYQIPCKTHYWITRNKVVWA